LIIDYLQFAEGVKTLSSRRQKFTRTADRDSTEM
jgi:hypothetical protein